MQSLTLPLMCSRYSAAADPKELAARFGAAPAPGQAKRWNLREGESAPVVIAAPARRISLLRFGLKPSWAEDGKPMVNARAETAAEKPFFRDAWRWRRALVPADAWYEAPRRGADKLPRLFRLKSGAPFAMAGLWEAGSFAVLTVPPNPLVARVHDRMPALLARDAEDAWLDPKTPPERLKDLLAPYPSELLEARRVSERLLSDADDARVQDEVRDAQGDLFGGA